jgi:ferritin-like metal-binding protein YciE
MADRDITTQLIKYLTDAHSIEEQALTQMKRAPAAAGDPELARIFDEHRAETEEHERLVSERLEALGAKPSRLKDVAMKVGGMGFVLFAQLQPDTPGKLVSHAYSYEHLELASYELLERVAERAGDEETAQVARRIRDQEARMAERLEGAFDRAVEASLAALEPDDLDEQLDKYLADAHAIEAQAITLLDKGRGIAGAEELARAFAEHLQETYDQQRLVEERLAARGASASSLKDAAMKLGALNWGGFFAAQPETPGKLAAFAFAFEHLEIAGYEQLRRVAERVGDGETVAMAERILDQERAAAAKIAGLFDRMVDASLEQVGVRA